MAWYDGQRRPDELATTWAVIPSGGDVMTDSRSDRGKKANAGRRGSNALQVFLALIQPLGCSQGHSCL